MDEKETKKESNSRNIDQSTVVCTECKGYMQYKGAGVYACEKCGHEAMDDFGVVRQFLEIRGPSNILEISEATGLDRHKISHLLREGRLEVSKYSEVALCCNRCGMPIRTGEFCHKCQQEMDALNERNQKRGIYNSLKDDLAKGEGKMRFVDKNKTKK